MSLRKIKPHDNYVLFLLHKIKLTLSHLITTSIEYSESLQSSKNNNILLKLFNRIIRLYIKTCIGIIKTLYWLIAPNMLFKLCFRHIILFGIMFATPSIIRLTIQPCLKYFRYHIFLRIVMGKEWVTKYETIKNKSNNKDLTYKQYSTFVSELDEMDGLDAWRINKSSHLYSYQRLQTDLIELRKFRQKCDEYDQCMSKNNHPMRELMQFLRSRIERNYCGITNPALYSVTRVGTKKLIEDFIHNMCTALNYIATNNKDNISISEKIVYFQELRHVLGRTALCLSGGGTLGAYHVGVVLAMHDSKLLPKIITGSSVGSVVAALVCTKQDHEMGDLVKDGVLNVKYFDRTQNRSWITGFYIRIRRFWQTGHFMDVTILRDCVRDNIGDITFLEAYQKTGRILNITVSGSDANTMPRLLNFLTAPNVVIWSAVIASCAIPFFFAPQELFIKSYLNDNDSSSKCSLKEDKEYKIEPIYLQGVTFSDGSVSHDLPMNKLSQLFNVDNFIVSQVNPHLVPFLFHSIVAPIPLFERLFHFLCREFALYLTTVLFNLREWRMLKGFAWINEVLTQKYTGDVTMVPDIPIKHYIRILSNPSLVMIQKCAQISGRSTYKHIQRLQGLCETEFTIDACLVQLRSKLVINENTMSRVDSFQAPHTQSYNMKGNELYVSRNYYENVNENMNRLHIPQTIYNSMIGNHNSHNNLNALNALNERNVNDMDSVGTPSELQAQLDVPHLPNVGSNDSLHKSMSVADLCSDLSHVM